MKAASDPALRDPTKTAEHYAHVITAARDAIEAYTRYENPVLFASAIPHFLRIGSALYSAGAAVEPCLAVFHEAAQLQLRFIIEGRRFQFLGRGGIDNYLELYSAAHLAGCSTELIGALRQCTYAEQPAPWLPRLIDQFCDVLLGRHVDTDAAQAAELGKVDARVAVLPGLFRAVSHQDLIATTAALESYLTQHWEPPIERQAKKT